MYDGFNSRMEIIGKQLVCNTFTRTDDTEKGEKLLARWPDAFAAMPSELTRAAIFGLISDKSGPRQILDDEQIESRADIKVLYTGRQLSIKDQTVWLECLILGRGEPLGKRIYTTQAALMRLCGLTKTGPNWATTEECLKRLSKAHLEIQFKRKGQEIHVTTGLLKYGYDESTGALYIRLDHDGAILFGNLAYIPREVRSALKNEIAKAILAYICGHQNGRKHTVHLDNLRKWCRYNGRLDKFENGCMKALHKLETAGVLTSGGSLVFKESGVKKVQWTRTKVHMSEFNNRKN